MRWDMPLFEPYFTYIKQGKKTKEGRVPDPTNPEKNYFNIKYGDTIRFCSLAKKEELRKNIRFITHYDSPEAMLKVEGIESLLPGTKTIEEGAKIYRSFPGYEERIKKYGIFCIVLKCQKHTTGSETS